MTHLSGVESRVTGIEVASGQARRLTPVDSRERFDTALALAMLKAAA